MIFVNLKFQASLWFATAQAGQARFFISRLFLWLLLHLACLLVLSPATGWTWYLWIWDSRHLSGLPLPRKAKPDFFSHLLLWLLLHLACLLVLSPAPGCLLCLWIWDLRHLYDLPLQRQSKQDFYQTCFFDCLFLTSTMWQPAFCLRHLWTRSSGNSWKINFKMPLHIGKKWRALVTIFILLVLQFSFFTICRKN